MWRDIFLLLLISVFKVYLPSWIFYIVRLFLQTNAALLSHRPGDTGVRTVTLFSNHIILARWFKLDMTENWQNQCKQANRLRSHAHSLVSSKSSFIRFKGDIENLPALIFTQLKNRARFSPSSTWRITSEVILGCPCSRTSCDIW